MTALDGMNVSLRLGDGGSPVESFTGIGGVQVTELDLTPQPPVVKSVADAGWQRINPATGTRRVRLRAQGIFTDSAMEAQVRVLALTLGTRNVELAFGSGETWRGPFAVTAYQRRAAHDTPVTMTFTLESAGAVTVS